MNIQHRDKLTTEGARYDRKTRLSKRELVRPGSKIPACTYSSDSIELNH